jgi:NAD(P)-dependent dehydrogenase (short-subunit alcohol dehydrogenase family)
MKTHVCITGVSSGLGHSLAKTFLEQGAEVYGCSRRAPADLIKQGLHFAAIDLSDATTGPKQFSQLIQGVTHFDHVVLNAGRLGAICDMQASELEDLRATMETNVWANKWLLDCLHADARTIRQVVAISSGASLSAHRGWNGYSLSKAALNILIKLYAAECPETHYTALAPGLVDTAMQDYLTQLPDDARYPKISSLKAAKGSDQMPSPDACARTIIATLPSLLERESGGYADIRKL